MHTPGLFPLLVKIVATYFSNCDERVSSTTGARISEAAKSDADNSISWQCAKLWNSSRFDLCL